MAGSYNGVAVPSDGKKIGYSGGKYQVPDNPIVPFIEGDGTGRDIWKASLRVFNAAVEKAYQGKRRVAWYQVFAGEKAKAKFDTWLPDETVEAIREFRVAIKGPLTTPVGGGIRSDHGRVRGFRAAAGADRARAGAAGGPPLHRRRSRSRRSRSARPRTRPLEEILLVLRQRMGVDFTHYKHATLAAAHPAADGAAQAGFAEGLRRLTCAAIPPRPASFTATS